MDHERYRIDARQRWEAQAAGWAARREAFQAATEPVSRWLVDAVDPQAGDTVLDLAAGLGDTGFLAAPRIEPGGRLISTDGAEAMVELAGARARELGLGNVEARPMEAEWIDLPAASVDAVLCRWGYMLLADPEAALRETRRVLRPGGRVAFAAWDAPARNPWLSTAAAAMVALGLAERPLPDEPGPFAFAPPGRIEELVGAAGLGELRVERIDFAFATPSFDEYWETQYDLSATLVAAMATASPEQRDLLYERVEGDLVAHRAADGSLRIPARALVAVAEA